MSGLSQERTAIDRIQAVQEASCPSFIEGPGETVSQAEWHSTVLHFLNAYYSSIAHGFTAEPRQSHHVHAAERVQSAGNCFSIKQQLQTA